MDDLVVIILTLVFAGIGAYGQMKKKKKLPEAPENNAMQDDIWGLFGKISGIENLQEDPYGTTEIVVKEPGSAVNEQNYTFEATEEGGSMIGKATVEQKRIVRKNELKKKFSLKQAVVYNEILNRKYF